LGDQRFNEVPVERQRRQECGLTHAGTRGRSYARCKAIETTGTLRRCRRACPTGVGTTMARALTQSLA
jgi:hypothetical protein